MTSPTLRRRRLSTELRRRRVQAGFTLSDAADVLRWSPAKLGHIETGIRKWPSVVEVSALLQLYGVTGGQRDAIIALARQARMRPWWSNYSDVVSSAYVGNEAGAVAVDTYSGTLLPDLLHLPEYTAALARSLGWSEHGVQRMVAAYTRRQELLGQEGLHRYRAVFGEEALWRIPEPLRREQLEHLVEAAETGRAFLHLLPASAGPHPGGSGAFTLWEFEDEEALAHVEAPYGGGIVESPEGLMQCRAAWQRVLRLAWDGPTTLRALEGWTSAA